MRNLIRRDFTQIPNDLINDTDISRDARFLFVYLCSKPDDWKFYNTVICKDLGCSDDSRRKYTGELVKKGWITITQTKNNKGEFKENDITLNPYPKISEAGKTPMRENTASEKNGIGKTPVHNNTNSETNNELFNNTEVPAMPVDVINYLNIAKFGKQDGNGFKQTSANATLVKSRVKEGFKLDDFKKVIDASAVKWLNDPKMKQYIRPETLFGSKMATYLAEADDVLKSANRAGADNFVFEPTETANLK